MLLLFERDGETWLVLTRRTNSVATHKGQISLPGGTREASDESLMRTALRETEEEIGIPADQIQVLGKLPQTPTATSNFNVTPFVGRLAAIPTYRPHEPEVAEVIEIPVSVLRDPTRICEQEVVSSRGRIRAEGFCYGRYFIWGATARILREFLRISGSEDSPF